MPKVCPRLLKSSLNALGLQRRKWQRIPSMKDSWLRRQTKPAQPTILALSSFLHSTPAHSAVLLQAKKAPQAPSLLVSHFEGLSFSQPLLSGLIGYKLKGAFFTFRHTRGLIFYFFQKFKFKGKSFRWHRRKGSLVLKFGTSHLVALKFPFFVRTKRSGKMKMLFFGTSLYLLRFFLHQARNWRPTNIYHARGLRFARQRIMRKHGKVSAFR